MDLQSLLDKAERRLKDIHPTLADKARELVKRAHSEGICVIITQGLRTVAEQNDLYAQGRTKPGKIVTNAKGGYSYHNYGLAFDFCVTDIKGTPEWTVDKRWHRVGAIGQFLGLEWGGAWKSFKDYPHFQLTFGLSLADLRAGKQPGGAIAAKSYLEQGDRGDKVKELQQKLVKLGYTLDADGIYGKDTTNTVMMLQRRTGLSVDGIAGANTLAKIDVLLSAENKEPEKEPSGKWRVYTGTFSSKAQAELAAENIRKAFGYNPQIREE